MGKAFSAVRLFWITGAVALALDQLTKLTIYQRLLENARETVVVPGFFYLGAAQNPGVVWGVMSNAPAVVFVVALLAAGLVVAYFLRYSGRTTHEALAWGMILGGAVGNIIDRALPGRAVKDFIIIQVAGWRWPTFNVADAFITVGAVLIAWVFIFPRDSDKASRSRS